MTQEDNRSSAQKWKEFWGRKSILEPVPFTETSILTQPITFKVGRSGHFLQLPSNTAAIITSSTGQKQVFVEGGYKKLQEGAYTLQFVDLSERFIALPPITAFTKDGSEISVTVSISYKIYDPSLIINVATPLQNLFSMCEAAIRNFIVTHRHDELIGEPGSDLFIADYEIIQFFKEQVAMNQACRAFWVMDVIIKERYGNPEISKIKHVDLVQEKKNLTERKNVIQQQGIAEEQKILATTKAEQDRIVKEMQALSEANQSEILERTHRLNIELETLRKLPDWQNAQNMKKFEILEKAVDALIRAQTTAGFPRNMEDVRLVESILGSLSDVSKITPQLPPERLKSVNELSSTIINLIVPKNREK